MIDLVQLRALLAAATPGEWRALEDGNQYVNTSYMPTAKCVAAARIEGPVRPWNPHAYLAFGFKPKEFETVRFVSADAALICAAVNALPELLAIAEVYGRAVIVAVDEALGEVQRQCGGGIDPRIMLEARGAGVSRGRSLLDAARKEGT